PRRRGAGRSRLLEAVRPIWLDRRQRGPGGREQAVGRRGVARLEWPDRAQSRPSSCGDGRLRRCGAPSRSARIPRSLREATRGASIPSTQTRVRAPFPRSPSASGSSAYTRSERTYLPKPSAIILPTTLLASATRRLSLAVAAAAIAGLVVVRQIG